MLTCIALIICHFAECGDLHIRSLGRFQPRFHPAFPHTLRISLFIPGLLCDGLPKLADWVVKEQRWGEDQGFNICMGLDETQAEGRRFQRTYCIAEG